ncbi:transmembrane sensor/regulator PpyR [Pseudomonas paeninsulae]|uniref:transmembrane sensor/regulator PpyR n=1 Tax=Pseudomonas paeninsulae TaxID=3110772 RepID=UPI002D78405A|nr:transmembrane sensor/regulator PpyR [Pseudomonas sp. IT1137]
MFTPAEFDPSGAVAPDGFRNRSTVMNLFDCPQRLLRLSNQLLSGGGAALLLGVLGAYGWAEHLSLGTLIGAHSLTILGPTLLKVGYVIRLLAEKPARAGAATACYCAV